MSRAVVIGGGPAGLMAADQLARAGLAVTLCDAMPSLGRKFLMAGKSGLNLTKAEPFDTLVRHYSPDDWLVPMLQAFDAQAVQDWARGLGQEVFVGSTGRVFPTVMKASPLLRAWLAELDRLGVQRRVRWRWQGWQAETLVFDTPQGAQLLQPDVIVLALGGASWARLGADGRWTAPLAARDVQIQPFQPSNASVSVNWSAHMAGTFGQALKSVCFRAGTMQSRAEAVITSNGLEGGGVYALSPALRDRAELAIDLMPDLSLAEVTRRLSRSRGRSSLSNHLRKTLRLGPARTAILMECGRPIPAEPDTLAQRIKHLVVPYQGLGPLDQAISTTGGVARDALDAQLMLRACPGVFCAGEMLDWDAPTGGYLITACLATGRWAGRQAARYVSEASDITLR